MEKFGISSIIFSPKQKMVVVPQLTERRGRVSDFVVPITTFFDVAHNTIKIHYLLSTKSFSDLTQRVTESHPRACRASRIP